MSITTPSNNGSIPGGDVRSRSSNALSDSRHSTQDRSYGRVTDAGNTIPEYQPTVKMSSEGDLLGRRAIIFTGPDGIRPHRVNVKFQQHVGEVSMKSTETTCALSYLFRGPVGMPFPKAKNGQINETGWEVEHLGTGFFT